MNVPVINCCDTPAAMNSEIPEPIPYFDTTSSIKNTRYEPKNSWMMIIALDRKSPYPGANAFIDVTRAASGTR